jgi:type IV secretion system protein TrbG
MKYILIFAVALASTANAQTNPTTAPPANGQTVQPPPVVMQRQPAPPDLSQAVRALQGGATSAPGTVPALSVPGVTSSGGGDIPRDYKVREVPLSPTAHSALAAGKPWMTDRNPATFGSDGRVLYTFGTGLPEVICAPLRVCVIELQAGEKIQGAPQVGDAVRWNITPATMGEGAGLTELIVIKPVQTGLDTNLVVPTSRRMYYLRLVSKPTEYVARVAFTYPEDAQIAWQKHTMAQQQREQRIDATRVVEMAPNAIDTLYFEYFIEGNDDELKPARVFDDGQKTYIQMPARTQFRELPVLMMTGPEGKPEIINYRVQGTMYVVDRLFDRGALLLGVGKQQRKVTITRASAKRSFRLPWQRDEFDQMRDGGGQ